MSYNFKEEESDLCPNKFEPLLSFIKNFELDRAEVMFKFERLLNRHDYVINEDKFELFKKTVLTNRRKRKNYEIVLCSKKNKQLDIDNRNESLHTTFSNNEDVVKILAQMTYSEIEKLSNKLNIFLPILINIREKRIICSNTIYDCIVNKKSLL